MQEKVEIEIKSLKYLYTNIVKKQIIDYAEKGIRSDNICAVFNFICNNPADLFGDFNRMKSKIYLELSNKKTKTKFI